MSATTIRFRALFEGRTDCHGQVKVGPDGEKLRASTKREGATDKEWEDHLAGTVDLGQVPILLDGTAAFGALDVDDTAINHALLAQSVKDAGLPLVVCRSRSGGAHLYLFLAEPIPAELMVERLKDWSRTLELQNPDGRPIEVFPKQIKVAAGSIGNWISLPYYGDSHRVAVSGGHDMDLHTFLAYAESKRISPADLQTLTEFMDDGPACLQKIVRAGGIKDGGRNNGLFNVAIYLRGKYKDEWEERLFAFNQEHVHPPLVTGEVNGVVASIRRATEDGNGQGYAYQCEMSPLAGTCACGSTGGDPAMAVECRNRLYGSKNIAILAAGGTPAGHPYAATSAGFTKKLKDGSCVLISNFTALILSKETVDDGGIGEAKTTFLVEIKIHGKTGTTRVPAEDFESLKWLMKLSIPGAPLAVVNERLNMAVSNAIKLLSGVPGTRTLYTRTGWLTAGDELFFAHLGGAIGRDGMTRAVAVNLGAEVDRYRLPIPPSGRPLRFAVDALIGLLDVADDALTVPLLAAMAAAPLGEWLDTGFTMWMQGKTGTFKTSLAETIQAGFGTSRRPLSSWRSTDNSLELLLAQARHVIACVDDFKPSGSQRDMEAEFKKLRSILHAQADHSARGRLTPNIVQRVSYYPGGILLITAERPPSHGTESDTARIIMLEMEAGDVSVPHLTESQHHADQGTLAAAMSGYIQWLALNNSPGHNPYKVQADNLREQFALHVPHARTAENLSTLLTAAYTLADFVGEVDTTLGANLRERMGDALCSPKLATWQGAFQGEENPGQRFLALLVEGLATGKFHLALDARPAHPTAWGYRQGSEPLYIKSQGQHIGYLDLKTRDSAEVCLIPEAAHAEVRRSASATGRPFGASASETWRALADLEISTTEPNPDRPNPRTLVRRKHEGAARFLVLPVTAIRPDGETICEHFPSHF